MYEKIKMKLIKIIKTWKKKIFIGKTPEKGAFIKKWLVIEINFEIDEKIILPLLQRLYLDQENFFQFLNCLKRWSERPYELLPIQIPKSKVNRNYFSDRRLVHHWQGTGTEPLYHSSIVLVYIIGYSEERWLLIHKLSLEQVGWIALKKLKFKQIAQFV